MRRWGANKSSITYVSTKRQASDVCTRQDYTVKLSTAANCMHTGCGGDRSLWPRYLAWRCLLICWIYVQATLAPSKGCAQQQHGRSISLACLCAMRDRTGKRTIYGHVSIHLRRMHRMTGCFPIRTCHAMLMTRMLVLVLTPSLRVPQQQPCPSAW